MKRFITCTVLVLFAVFSFLPVSVNAEEDWRTWSQHDSRWGSLYMGSDQEATVSGYGCAVTAVTKLMIQSGFQSSDSFNVATLTNWMNENGGFESNGGIRWAIPCGITSGFNFAGYVQGISYSSVDFAPTILSWVEEGYHIVLGVGGHYIAIDNYKTAATNQVYIMDSGLVENNADMLLTDAYGTIYEYVLYTGYADGILLPGQTGIEYEVENNEVTITDCNVSVRGDLSIPETIDGYPVIQIADFAFEDCINLTGVTIPDSVTKIGRLAFSGCTGLTRVEIGSSVTSMGDYVFDNCTYLSAIRVKEENPAFSSDSSGVLYNKNKTELIRAPLAISGSYTMPDSVELIWYGAFEDCHKMTNLVLSENLKSIDSTSFWNLNNLQYNVRNNIKYLGTDTNPYFAMFGLALDEPTVCQMQADTKLIALYAFCDCENLTGFEFSDGISQIYRSTFSGCSSLKYVAFGNSITKIGDEAFQGCTALCELVIPDSVTELGYYAFAECTSLTSVTIGNGITKLMGSYEFYGCTSLKTLSLPNGIQRFYLSGLRGCSSLEYNNYEGGIYLGNEENPYLVFCGMAEERPSIKTHSDTRCIRESAFEGKEYLEYVDISEGITEILGGFYNCTNLKYVSLPNSLTSNPSFQYCTSLRSIFIPVGVSDIHPMDFYGSGLKNIWIDTENPYFMHDSRGVIYTKDGKWLVYMPVLIQGEYEIPDGVLGTTGAANYPSFTHCDLLTSLTVPATMTEGMMVGFGSNCNNLKQVIYKTGITKIETANFYNCPNLNTVVIPDTVTYFGNFLFYNHAEGMTIYYSGTEAQWQAIKNVNIIPDTATVVYEYRPMVNGKVDSWGLVLKGDISVNFQMRFTEEIQADSLAYVEIQVADQVTKIPVAQALDGFGVEIAAAQMTEEIVVCVVAGDGTRGDSESYSVAEYGNFILSGAYDDATKNLVRAMLCYGAKAQIYFGYREDCLASTENASAVIPYTANSGISAGGRVQGIRLYGVSMLYRNQLALRYYFECDGNITEYTFKANGTEYTPVKKLGRYYIEISDIAPQDLDEIITVAVTDSNGAMLSVEYSPMHYIARQYYKEGALSDLKNLLQALYAYHIAAKTYCNV